MKLVYDMASLPQGLTPSDFVKLMNNHSIVLWDSEKGGTKPKFFGGIDPATGDDKVLVVDMKGKTIDFDIYQKEYLDNEFWDKELYRCKKSHIYYYSNYFSPVFPIDNKGLREWSVAIGLQDLDMKDSETAENVWKGQKAKIEKATEHITIGELQLLKANMDRLKLEYKLSVEEMEKKVEHLVNIKDSEGRVLIEKKKILALVRDIAKIKDIPEKYSSYKFKKQDGRWDKSMLGQTPYGELLKMFIIVAKV